MANLLNHSFVIGETYLDRAGTYRVISIDGDRLVYEYADGIPHEGSAERKWCIHRSIVSEQSAPHTACPSQRRRSANGEGFFTYEEVSPIFADVIKAYGKRHENFMTHEEIVAAFMEHPEGQPILNRPHDSSNLYWAGVMKAHFSRKYNGGKSEWDDSFEGKKIGSDWAYRVRRKKN